MLLFCHEEPIHLHEEFWNLELLKMKIVTEIENLNGNTVPFIIGKQVRGEWKPGVWNLKKRETKWDVVASIFHNVNETYCVTLSEALSLCISKSAN